MVYREKITVNRGDVFWAHLTGGSGSTQQGYRPVVITQIDRLNAKSPTYICAAITSRLKKSDAPYHIVLPRIKGLPKTSMVLVEQRFTLDRNQLSKKVAHIPKGQMKKVTKAIRWSESEGRHKWKPNTFKKSSNYKSARKRKWKKRIQV